MKAIMLSRLLIKQNKEGHGGAPLTHYKIHCLKRIIKERTPKKESRAN